MLVLKPPSSGHWRDRGMTKAKLASILALQMSSDDKKARADLTLDSDLRKDQTRDELTNWLSAIGLPIVRK